MNTAFLKDTAERAVKTFAQALLAFLGANATGILDAAWGQALSVSGFAVVVSVLTSIAGGFTIGHSTSGSFLPDQGALPAPVDQLPTSK